jgi:YbbR domain-containing protein
MAGSGHQTGIAGHQQKQRSALMRFRDLILNNFWLKTFSLVLAVMVWLAIHSNIRTESMASQNPFRVPDNGEFARPIMLHVAPTDRQAYVVNPLSVNVKVNGDPDVLKKLNPEDIQAYVRLTDVQNPVGAFPVQVNLPRNVTLQQLWPSHVHVEPAKPQ